MLKEEINSRERGLPFAFACAFKLLTQEKINKKRTKNQNTQALLKIHSKYLYDGLSFSFMSNAARQLNVAPSQPP